jgi:hypothetical protein
VDLTVQIRSGGVLTKGFRGGRRWRRWRCCGQVLAGDDVPEAPGDGGGVDGARLD